MDLYTKSVRHGTRREARVPSSSTSAWIVSRIALAKAMPKKRAIQERQIRQPMIAAVRYTLDFRPNARPSTSCTFTIRYTESLRAAQRIIKGRSFVSISNYGQMQP